MINCEDCLHRSVCDDKEKDCGICDAYEKRPRLSAYERTRAQVYATGNKWAIENFHATHD